MPVSASGLKDAVRKGLLREEQLGPLLEHLREWDTRHGPRPKFDFTHLLYYLGGMVAIGAMSLFMNLGWEAFGGWGIVALCAAYALAGLLLTNRFRETGYLIPAGICAAFVLTLTPLAVYGFQHGMGWWPDDSTYSEFHRHIKLLWIYMELATLLVAAVLLFRYRFPFLMMPLAVTLWYMSMDLAEMVLGSDLHWRERRLFTCWFGLGITVFALWVDIRARRSLDYAFWLYLFGVMAFWGGLTVQNSDSDLNKFLYFCINLVMIGCGAVLMRKVFVVFGAIGCCLCLGYLANEVFEDSWLFPVALTLIGLGIIGLGILWQKHEARITASVRSCLPAPVRELLDARHG